MISLRSYGVPDVALGAVWLVTPGRSPLCLCLHSRLAGSLALPRPAFEKQWWSCDQLRHAGCETGESSDVPLAFYRCRRSHGRPPQFSVESWYNFVCLLLPLTSSDVVKSMVSWWVLYLFCIFCSEVFSNLFLRLGSSNAGTTNVGNVIERRGA